MTREEIEEQALLTELIIRPAGITCGCGRRLWWPGAVITNDLPDTVALPMAELLDRMRIHLQLDQLTHIAGAAFGR